MYTSNVQYYTILCLLYAFNSHAENNCLIASFHRDGRVGPIELAKSRHFSLRCLYQARKVSGHVFVC